MARVGADLKQKLLDSVRSTWNSVYQLAMFHKPDNQILEREIDKVVEEQMSHPPSDPEVQSEDGGEDLKVGKLNGGRRIDYVLQEAPFEYINEYIFALSSHVCYWLVPFHKLKCLIFISNIIFKEKSNLNPKIEFHI